MTGCSILDFGTPARKNGKKLPCEAMQVEISKLRTFIDGLMFCHASSAYDDCIGCPLLDQSTHNYRCTKTECMQELGIGDADA